ncbi:hypothetical protein AA313_de0203971 [Arthrobotrys entomopaga]|nr:hypothetical protein AA313_de0203971 [Arthrobotrys entomopaga]
MSTETAPDLSPLQTTPVIENHDGADFRKNFSLLQVTTVENSQNGPNPTTQNANEAMPDGKYENSAVIVMANENSQPTKNNHQDHEAHPTESPSAQETSAHEGGLSTNIVENAQPKGQRDPKAAENSSPTTISRQSTISANSQTSKDSNIDQRHNGFVKYLADKASYEIQRDNADAAKPYLRRLQEISGTEKVTAELKNQIYSRIVALGKEMLSKRNVSGAYDLLAKLDSEETAPYRDELIDAIEEAFALSVQKTLSTGDREMAMKILGRLKELQKGMIRTGSSVEPGNAGKILLTIAKNISQDAIKEVKNGNKFHNSKKIALASVEFLYAMDVSLIGTESRANLCNAIAREYLLRAKRQPLGTNDNPWDCLIPLNAADEFLRIAEVDEYNGLGPDPESEFRGWDNLEALIKYHIGRKYEKIPGVEQGTFDLRLDVLICLENYFKARVYRYLKAIAPPWSDILRLLQCLRIFWDHPRSTEVAYFEDQDYLRVIGLFVWAHYRMWACFTDEEIRKINYDSLTAERQYLFLYTVAKWHYFNHRNLELALEFCHAARALNVEKTDGFFSTSDVLYLMGRIFTRQGYPLDADYHYSLIPDFEKYDEWGIYGQAKELFQDYDFKISRGELTISDDSLAKVCNMIAFPAEPGLETNNTKIRQLFECLFADDVKWLEKETDASTVITPDSLDMFQGVPFLIHVCRYLSGRCIKCLEVILQNPWLVLTDAKPPAAGLMLHTAAKFCLLSKIVLLLEGGVPIDLLDSFGNTALHYLLSFSDDLSTVAPVSKALNHLLLSKEFNQLTDKGCMLLTHRNDSGKLALDYFLSAVSKLVDKPFAIQDSSAQEAARNKFARFEHAYDTLYSMNMPQDIWDEIRRQMADITRNLSHLRIRLEKQPKPGPFFVPAAPSTTLRYELHAVEKTEVGPEVDPNFTVVLQKQKKSGFLRRLLR